MQESFKDILNIITSKIVQLDNGDLSEKFFKTVNFYFNALCHISLEKFKEHLDVFSSVFESVLMQFILHNEEWKYSEPKCDIWGKLKEVKKRNEHVFKFLMDASMDVIVKSAFNPELNVGMIIDLLENVAHIFSYDIDSYMRLMRSLVGDRLSCWQAPADEMIIMSYIYDEHSDIMVYGDNVSKFFFMTPSSSMYHEYILRYLLVAKVLKDLPSLSILSEFNWLVSELLRANIVLKKLVSKKTSECFDSSVHLPQIEEFDVETLIFSSIETTNICLETITSAMGGNCQSNSGEPLCHLPSILTFSMSAIGEGHSGYCEVIAHTFSASMKTTRDAESARTPINTLIKDILGNNRFNLSLISTNNLYEDPKFECSGKYTDRQRLGLCYGLIMAEKIVLSDLIDIFNTIDLHLKAYPVGKQGMALRAFVRMFSIH